MWLSKMRIRLNLRPRTIGIAGSDRRVAARLTALAALAALATTLACGCDPVAVCDRHGQLCTLVGNGEAGFDGDNNPLLQSSLYWPVDVTITPSGDRYILDWNNHAVRKIVGDDHLQTVIGSGFVGDGPPDLSDLTAPGALGTTVDLNHPTQLVPDLDGSLVLVAWHNHKLRRFDPKTERVLVVCGSDAGFAGDGGVAEKALLNQPTQIAIAPDGGRYILDMRNQVVRLIDAKGIIHTVAGTLKTKGYQGDGGPPGAAQFNFPSGSNPTPGGALALASDGVLYLSDSLNHAIRRIDFAKDRIDTVAGTGTAGFSGDGGAATAAQLNNPRDLQLSADGKVLFIADELNHRIRALDLVAGTIRTVAGDGKAGYDGEGRNATQTSLNRPAGLALDATGQLYIADTYNHRIRVLIPEAL
mgnify:CR=1 FL=1